MLFSAEFIQLELLTFEINLLIRVASHITNSIEGFHKSTKFLSNFRQTTCFLKLSKLYQDTMNKVLRAVMLL